MGMRRQCMLTGVWSQSTSIQCAVKGVACSPSRTAISHRPHQHTQPPHMTRPAEKRLHVLMQKVHTIRNDKNKKRKEAHVESLRLQAKRMAKKEETLNEVRVDLSVPSLFPLLCRW